ncbi:hypothetical protein HDV00_010769 [Rhizophlyctis rosea]|nr:hypothetical protein HDV00_010769 [Rhizophlyctis rosea]
MPQRFTLDSFPLAHAVKDSMPSALDVAYSVFDTQAAGSWLEDHIAQAERNGYMEARELRRDRVRALKDVMNELSDNIWTHSIYSLWLRTLRNRSPNTATPPHPQTMRTTQWASRTMDAQLSSWTQLRHDTILYVEQSGAMMTCEHPAIYVDPNPPFWQAFIDMTTRTAEVVNDAQGMMEALRKVETHPTTHSYRNATRMTDHFTHFTSILSTLHDALRTLASNQPLKPEQFTALKDILHHTPGYDCGPSPTYDGWYPSLFYTSPSQCMDAEYLVADVHTQLLRRNPSRGTWIHSTDGSGC